MLISRAINPDCLGTALVAEFFGLCLSSHFASIRVQAIVGDISRGHRLPLPHPLSGPRRTRPQDLQRRGLPAQATPSPIVVRPIGLFGPALARSESSDALKAGLPSVVQGMAHYAVR